MSGIEDDGYSEEEEEVSSSEDLGTGAGDGTAPPPEPEPTPDYTGPGESEDEPPPPPKRRPDRDDDDEPEPPPPVIPEPPPDPDPGDDFGPGSGGYIAPPPLPPPLSDPFIDPGIDSAPPDPVYVPPADDTVSSQTTEVLLQSAADQHQAKLEELYEKKRSGKISDSEYAAKKKRLTSRHIRLVNYLQTGTGLKGHRKSAVDKWAAKTEVLVKQAAVDHIAAVKDALAGYATLTATEVLRLRAEGKITAAQQAELIAQIETQHLANLLGVDQGVLQASPFQLYYTIPAETTTHEVLIQQKDLDVALGLQDFIPGLQPTDVDGKEEEPWFEGVKIEDTIPIVTWDTERPFEVVGVEQRPTLDRSIADQAMEDLIENLSAGARKVIPYASQYVIFDTERLEETTAELKPLLPRSLADDPITALFNIEAYTGVTIPVFDTESMSEIFVSKASKEANEAADKVIEVFMGKVEEVQAAIDQIPLDAREPEPFVGTTIDTETLSEVPSGVVGIEGKPDPEAAKLADVAAGTVLYQMEKPLRAVSTTLRDIGKGFREEAAEKEWWYSKMVYGGVGLGLRVAGSAFEQATMPIRPILIAETVGGLAKLATDAETRAGAVEAIISDPIGFGADIVGGLIGGWALTRLPGIRYADVDVPLEAGGRAGWRGLYLSYGDDAYRFSKTVTLYDDAGNIIGLADDLDGLVQHAIQPGYVPTSKLESQVTIDAMKMAGYTDDQLRLVDDVRGVISKTHEVPSKFIDSKLPIKTGTLGESGTQALKDFFLKNIDEIDEVYGSYPTRSQLSTAYEYSLEGKSALRLPGDIDVMVTGSADDIADFASRLADELIASGEDVRISSQSPTLIESHVGDGTWAHAVDIHAVGEVIEGTLPATAWGFKVDQAPITIEGLPVQALGEQGLRKGVSILGFTDEFDIGPLAHRTKDIPDFMQVQRTLIDSSRGLGYGVREQLGRVGDYYGVVDLTALGAVDDVVRMPLQFGKTPSPGLTRYASIGSRGLSALRPSGHTILASYAETAPILEDDLPYEPPSLISRRSDLSSYRSSPSTRSYELPSTTSYSVPSSPPLGFELYKPSSPLPSRRRSRRSTPPPPPSPPPSPPPYKPPSSGTYKPPSPPPSPHISPPPSPPPYKPPPSPPPPSDSYYRPPPPPYSRSPRRRWKPEDDENEIAKMIRPSFGIIRAGRVVKIGTPTQALRGIFRPPRPPARTTKRKKKKKDEEDDFLSILFR